jgi:hypothetical protein
MPTYIDTEGRRYWFDTPPEPGTVRDDLILTTDDEPDATPIVPQAVTMAQARLALLGAGITASTVDAQIAAIPDDFLREAAKIQWEYEANVKRDSPLIASIGPALGLTDEQIDQLFITASTL